MTTRAPHSRRYRLHLVDRAELAKVQRQAAMRAKMEEQNAVFERQLEEIVDGRR